MKVLTEKEFLYKQGKKEALDEIEKHIDEYNEYTEGEPCESCIKDIKEKISTIRQKP